MEIPPALPAATILVVRDGPTGLEVLLVRRHGKSSFAPGALVFPGGKVDAGDAELARLCPDSELLSYRVAAIRETWEEAGILLARRKGADRMLGSDEVPRPGTAESLPAILARDGIELATDRLARFAHWITPEAEPRRFDTQFFIAEAPAGQTAAADGHETLDCAWLSPADALREADAGRALIVFPTRLNLMKLDRSRTAAEALDRAAREPVVAVRPVMLTEAGERIIRIDSGSGYELTEMRFAMRRPTP
jgi:8-oxo-dGTP pyrophosphatase MutT (NUDIX family)